MENRKMDGIEKAFVIILGITLLLGGSFIFYIIYDSYKNPFQVKTEEKYSLQDARKIGGKYIYNSLPYNSKEERFLKVCQYDVSIRCYAETVESRKETSIGFISYDKETPEVTIEKKKLKIEAEKMAKELNAKIIRN